MTREQWYKGWHNFRASGQHQNDYDEVTWRFRGDIIFLETWEMRKSVDPLHFSLKFRIRQYRIQKYKMKNTWSIKIEKGVWSIPDEKWVKDL